MACQLNAASYWYCAGAGHILHSVCSLSPKPSIILLLTLMYFSSFCPIILSFAIFLMPKHQRLPLGCVWSPGYMLCRHFLELWNFFPKFSSDHRFSVQSPTNTLAPYASTYSHLSLWISLCNCVLILVSFFSYCQVCALFLGLFISLGASW